MKQSPVSKSCKRRASRNESAPFSQHAAFAVLSGTSLFGGCRTVLPGTLLGSLLIQMIESGLVMLNANPYLYPLVTAAVIFLAVFLDAARQTSLEKLNRRSIYREV
jgi:ribose transport system permease protein